MPPVGDPPRVVTPGVTPKATDPHTSGPAKTPTPIGTPTPTPLDRGDGLDSRGTPTTPTGSAPETHPTRGLLSAGRSTDYRSLPGYTNATPEQKARIDALMARLGGADKAALRDVLASPAWADTASRDNILTSIEHLPQSGDLGGSNRYRGATRGLSPLESFALLARPRPGQSTPPLLDRAHGGQNLAHHLAHFATTTPDAEVTTAIAPNTHQQMFGELVREVADPGRINQTGAGTCGATTLQYQLVSTHPAEYVRLSAGLMNPGEVRMRNGETLRRDMDSIQPSPGSMRSPTERVFQSAVMEYGSSANYRYDGTEDVQDGNIMDRLPMWLQILAWILFPIGLILALIPLEEGGLMGWEYDKAAEGLFGADQTQRYSYSGLPHSQESQLDELRGLRPDGNFEGLGVGISLKWGVGHFLNVVRLDDRTTPPCLILRNPHGSYSTRNLGDPVGGRAPSGSTVEDPERGTIRVPLTEENTALITGLYYPDALAA